MQHGKGSPFLIAYVAELLDIKLVT